MPSLAPYDRKLDYSYAPGIFPSMEAVKKAPELVRRLLISAQAEDSEGVAALTELCRARNIRVETADKALARLSGKGNCYAAAVFEKRPGVLNPEAAHIVLHHPSDAGNLGTILRTADAFGVPVLLSEGCADPYGEKTVRASMGAVFRTPPMQGTAEEILAACAEARVPLCATALSDRSRDIRQLRLSDYALVIGSEGQGVGAAYLEAAAELGIIPMEPRCESLNAAAAAAVLLWQLRQGL